MENNKKKCRFFRTEVSLDELRMEWERWESKRMIFPAWFAFFSWNRSHYCKKYNHVMGYGCNSKTCRKKHACMLCGTLEHGAFFRSREKIFVCESTRYIRENFEKFLDERIFVENMMKAVTF